MGIKFQLNYNVEEENCESFTYVCLCKYRFKPKKVVGYSCHRVVVPWKWVIGQFKCVLITCLGKIIVCDEVCFLNVSP